MTCSWFLMAWQTDGLLISKQCQLVHSLFMTCWWFDNDLFTIFNDLLRNKYLFLTFLRKPTPTVITMQILKNVIYNVIIWIFLMRMLFQSWLWVSFSKNNRGWVRLWHTQGRNIIFECLISLQILVFLGRDIAIFWFRREM